MITEDYVSHEVAKLLKDIGFLKGVDLRYTQNLSYYDSIGLHHNLNEDYNSLILDKIDFVVAPTLQMACKWLREIYNIDILPQVYYLHVKCYRCMITNGVETITLQEPKFSYEKAVETAIKYCLENLI